MITLIYAHPYPNRSRANRVLLDAVRDVSGLAVRSLYDLYPGFEIDVEAEQAALGSAHTLVWQHPMYWYSVPGLLKHWFDKVLARGWAYGAGGTALQGKRCLWVTTTGGDEQAFQATGMHAHPLSAFVPPVEQTARFCGMSWLEPLVVHAAHKISRVELSEHARDYRQRIEQLSSATGGEGG
ncbi:MAG TPA: glutathione-regulated potassium-efflux system oxidoreductase KefF [Polyangiaceae bacterium]|nr:glutathione-regulated potassium-efflux system oxidoreductase KefF [Polyangiaceae bacterium]